MQETLLVELLTEELPPKSLHRLGAVFARAIGAALREQGFVAAGWDPESAEVIATPRRLAALIAGVLATQPDRMVERKGPYVASGLDRDGRPTPALAGFAKSVGAAVESLDRASDAKGEYFVFRGRKAGEPLDGHLAAIVRDAIKQLPIPKVMRWGASEVQFVRPVHGLVMMHGARVVPGEVLGLQSGNSTLGHRFMGEGAVTIPHADQYLEVLAARGAVVARFADRRDTIARELAKAAQAVGAQLVEPEGLLDEVTSLVESPAVYRGEFSTDFLAVPQECLILSMKQHQKYFPLADAGGRLKPMFLVVSNLQTAEPGNIVHGNERVLRARLSDARFFYDQDRKTRLEARTPRLASVVYHNKLGSQLQRVQRIRKLAGNIAHRLGADVALAERAAWLAKADLVTDMVGEFPELQGIMGEYYARHDGEPETVARAIEAHYHPRFAGDSLPADNVGAAVALADRLDTLVGIYGIGLAPTGDKDPFGLRRAALGVLRILAEKSLPLDLLQLLQLARSQFAAEAVADSVAVDLHGFMLERLRNHLREQDFRPDEIESVVSQNPTRIDQVAPRLKAVQAFRRLPEAEALAAANKRIQNILKKTQVPAGDPDLSLMEADAERALLAATRQLDPVVDSLLASGDYTDALTALARVRDEVDRFFDEVMVMTHVPLVRDNRLVLLRQLGDLMNRVADISKLAA